MLLGVAGAVADPASGGRHKVFGHPDLSIIPQTSTIASHLPRAVGVAFAIDRARRIGVDVRWPDDAVVVTSFGDASLNHSTAAGALNTAGYCVRLGLGRPGAVRLRGQRIRDLGAYAVRLGCRRRPAGRAIEYVAADGEDSVELEQVAAAAVERVRATRQPVFLHLRTVRYLGHAGTDVESGYRGVARDDRGSLARPAGRRWPDGSRRITVIDLLDSLRRDRRPSRADRREPARPASAGLRPPPSSPRSRRDAPMTIRAFAIRTAPDDRESGCSTAGCRSTPVR